MTLGRWTLQRVEGAFTGFLVRPTSRPPHSTDRILGARAPDRTRVLCLRESLKQLHSSGSHQARLPGDSSMSGKDGLPGGNTKPGGERVATLSFSANHPARTKHEFVGEPRSAIEQGARAWQEETAGGDPLPSSVTVHTKAVDESLSYPTASSVDLVRDVAPNPARLVAFPGIASAGTCGHHVRERVNAAARPILQAFARSRGIPLDRLLRKAIEGPTPLVDPAVLRQLGGAVHSEAMQHAIASNADPALVPLKVRAGLARLMAQSLSDPPPVAVQKSFPDWNKPLAPFGHRLQLWRPKDAAVWLRRFPPNERLLHPMTIWDPATAALWLNDREPILSGLPCEGEPDSTLVPFEMPTFWKPSLEVLHTLDELELETLSYRVFLERMRRDVMPFYLSERKTHVRVAIERVTFGYQTLEEARRSLRTHDRQRIRYFNRVFGENHEWIYDLSCRIIAAYEWPEGFSEPDLWAEFSNLWDAQQ